MALSQEELAELKQLEAEEAAEAKADADAADKQHLEALRMRKQLGAKLGKHGRDFVVLETDVGVNVAVRQPTEMETDIASEKNNAEGHEAFAKAVTVTPQGDELTRLIVKWPGIRTAIIKAGFELMGGVREERAKK